MLRLPKILKIAVLWLLMFTVGCAGSNKEVTAGLNKEFTLRIGQTAAIQGESLLVGLVEVVGDSRCPRGVTCIWQGEVTCAVRVTVNGVTEDVVWKQPGLTAEQSRIAYKGYRFAFEVEPYPEAGQTISQDEYRIRMVVSKG